MLTIKITKKIITFSEFNSFSSGINNTPENIILNTLMLINCKNLMNLLIKALFTLSTKHLLSQKIKDINTMNNLFSQQRLVLIPLIKNRFPATDVSFLNFSYEFCPKEGNAGGTLIYIRKRLSYKIRIDLKIYKSFELESTLIEVCNATKMIINIGCIYKHPNMKTNEFKDVCLNKFRSFVVNYLKKIKLYFFLVTLTLAC